MKRPWYLLSILFLGTNLLAQESTSVQPEEIQKICFYLASDEMKGRQNGSPEMKEAARFIQDQFKLAGLSPMPGTDSYFQEYTIVRRNGDSIPERNVIGFLEGTDPKLKGEYLIFSAHFDHVGIGRPVDGDSIYNGANDNCAGTATIISLAQSLHKAGIQLKRSAIFLAVSGEEWGMYGSRHFVENPGIDLDKVLIDFNIEMTGHCSLLGEKRYYLTGSSFTNFDQIMDEYNKQTDWVRTDTVSSADRLFFASDNAAFAVKRDGNTSELKIPAFTLCTHGGEDHIHRPNDEPQFMDYNNMASLVTYLTGVASFLGAYDSKFEWDNKTFQDFMTTRQRR